MALQRDIDAAMYAQATASEEAQFSAMERASGVAVKNVVGLGLALEHPFKLQSACGFPEWTNYVQGFTGCLDYIWCEQDAVEVSLTSFRTYSFGASAVAHMMG